ncbi:MAG: P1 family peptidase [Candidatus Baltobacteraceae bacterium]|jgi:L-aminopeptidase/D-esterase-like protein
MNARGTPQAAGSIVDVPGISVGHAHDVSARTGCTVVLTGRGAVCGVDVRGAAPGTRETDTLAPASHLEIVHALVLSGGSAFGLDAACGVMRVLEERGIGFAVGPFFVPIVPAAVLFDLFAGDGGVRPDGAMGAAAARAASREPPAEGRVGVGAGATVAKLAGPQRARDSGVGTASARHGELIVGALAVANAVGSIYDWRTGEAVALPLPGGEPYDERALLAQWQRLPLAGANTTLAVVATNANLRKVDATKVAQMAHDGLARVVVPAHLSLDGDTIFACATGGVAAPLDLVGAMAADVVAEAILRGVRAGSSPG